MHTPLTHQNQSGLTMPLSRQSVGIYQEMSPHATLSGNMWPQSSQLAEPLWTDPGINSGTSAHKLISTLKKEREKSVSGEYIVEHSPKSLASEEKAT